MALQYFILAFLAFQGVSSYNLTPVNHYDIERSLTNELDKVIEEAKQAVQDAVEQIIAISKEVYEQLNEELKQVVQNALEDVKQIVTKARDEIDGLVQEAAHLGEEAAQCAKAEEGNIDEAQQNFEKATNVCVYNAKEKITAVVNKALDTIKQINGKVQALVQEWNVCNNILCKIGVIAKIQTTVQEVQNTVIDFVDDAKKSLNILYPEFVNCSKQATAQHEDEVKIIIGRIRQCINNIEA